MKIMLLSLLLLSAPGLLPDARAQSSSAAPPTAPTTITASHFKAAEGLLAIVYPPGAFDKLIEQVLDAQIKQKPEIASVEPEMRAFFSKYMSWDAIKDELVTMYVHNFTEAELRDITAFYQTSSGQKMAANMPKLMQSGMELGQRRVQEHLPELQQAIEKKLKRKRDNMHEN